ncbi:MAG: hypothetical protein NTY20_03130 [Candidatus Aenigmarchaeota archaeon]|nr:hypothetical protein [Candidatus Aenigmarchaeota archaeon]
MITQSEIEVVIARLRAMPDNALVSAGFGGVMNREELIKHVRNANNDEIGRKIIEAHLSYMRSAGR